MNKEYEVLAGLNDQQKEAAMHIDGPALVTATAGAGKTKVVVTRAQHMILDMGIDPSLILLTTFTNKAANEMKERIINVVGERGKKITVGTYHSICNKILRQYCTYIGYVKTFTILDADDSEKIIKEIAKEYGEDVASLKTFISNCKINCKTPSMAQQEAQEKNTTRLSNCYQAYQDKLKRDQCMDFDDLLLNTVLLLESEPKVKEQVNNKWQYISTDETQDSSELDSRLMYALSGPNHNIFFVGDDDQCIYSFRGSDVTIILNLKSKYPNLKWYNLGVNYRSTETIVDAGQEIIKHNKNKLQKEVTCGKKIPGAPIIISETGNQEQEAKRVVTFIKTLHNRSSMPVPYKEMAILYRMSHLSRIFEKELMKNKIKYKLVGGTPFFSRMEIKDILSYARLTVNQYDVQSFKRSIAIPKRGIGDKSIEKIESFMMNNVDMSIRKALVNKDLPLKGKAKKGIEEYNKLLEDLDTKKVELSPEEFIKYIIQRIDYLEFMKNTKEYNDNYEERVENLNELITVAKEFNNIEDLLVEASIFQEQDNIEDDEDAVQLMTIHKSKGLEFDAVFMTNTVEGTLPHYKSLEDPAQLEEERRVMFVGCTRARKNLFITYPKKQMIMNTEKYVKRSRFINEINKKHIKVI